MVTVSNCMPFCIPSSLPLLRFDLQLSSVLVDVELLQSKLLEVLTALFHVVSKENIVILKTLVLAPKPRPDN